MPSDRLASYPLWCFFWYLLSFKLCLHHRGKSISSVLDKSKFSLAEKSISTLIQIWKLPELPADIRTAVVKDILKVLGQSIQVKHRQYSSSIWSRSLVLFLEILSNGMGYLGIQLKMSSLDFLEKATSQCAEPESHKIWSDLVDDIQSFLIGSLTHQPDQKQPTAEEEKRDEEWDLTLCSLLTNLIYHSSLSSHSQVKAIQPRLVNLLLLWAKSKKKWSHEGRKTAIEYTNQMYSLLFSLCSGNYSESDTGIISFNPNNSSRNEQVIVSRDNANYDKPLRPASHLLCSRRSSQEEHGPN